MSLTILLDQNISIEVARWARTNYPGFTIHHTSEIKLSTKPDIEIFQWAQKNQATIITFDSDFADQRSFPVKAHSGIIRLKVWPTTVEETQDALQRLFEKFTADEITGSLVIVDRNRIRLRRA